MTSPARDGQHVRCLVRDRNSSRARELERQGFELHQGDALRPDTLRGAGRGLDAAYHLIHSMGRGGPRDFAPRERAAATAVAHMARGEGIERVLYLGGLGDQPHSEHLRSRHEPHVSCAGAGLRSPTTRRDGHRPQSESFRTLRYLVQRLPAMIAPAWLQNPTQPIAIADTLRYLVEALEVDESVGREIQVGGPDTLTYGQMLDRMAEALGLPRRPRIPVPLITPGLSSPWSRARSPPPAYTIGVRSARLGRVHSLRVAIVGYGLSGRFFHAPLIEATAGLELVTVVTADPDRQQQVADEHPGATAVADLSGLWPISPDLLVVATPNSSHVEIASASIERGIPVVVDKPLAVTAAEANALVAQAERAGVVLTVFQNRRWDTDQLTLRRLIAEDALGQIMRYESRFERWRPELDPAKWRETAAPEQGGGVLLDLGSHLVDQALALFGPVTDVYGEIASRRGAPGDDDAFVALRHATGTISHLYASAVTPSIGPRLRVQGTAAGFLVPGVDGQEAALRAGARPAATGDWGLPSEWEHGRLMAGERSVPVPPEPGDWPRFYSLLDGALRGEGPLPVDPRDAVETLRVLEAARRPA